MEYTDLLYFGYDYPPYSLESKNFQDQFIEEIKQRFPSVELNDCYDSIKGYRQEVCLDKKENENYYAWLVAYGWSELSLTFSILMMDDDNIEEVRKYISLAKEQYPQNFKTQTNDKGTNQTSI